MTAVLEQSPTLTQRGNSVAITARRLCKSYDQRPVLRSIDLTVPCGEYLAILGINGAGKTTLLKTISTLTPPTSGRLELFGLALPQKASAARARLGLIGHQSMLYADLTARENLEFFARLYRVSNPKGRAEELLTTVGLIDRADDPVKALSRGMNQRVSIARALVHDPDLLLADEPFAGLDVPGAAAVERLLANLHTAGKTVVLVNHDVAQSLRLAQRVLVLRNGQIAVDQPADAMDAASVIDEMTR